MRFMKESGIEWIGEIPENWSTIRMKSCITKRDSGAWGDEPTGETGDIVCLRVADFDYNRFVFKDTDTDNLTKRHYSPDVIEKLKLNKNDILIEKSGGGEKTPVGRTVIFDKDYDALFANFLDRLKCAEFINPRYMQYTFVTFYKNQYIRNYIKQTTGIQNLDLSGMLSKETVPFPCYDEQKKIADFLDEKCAEIDTVIEKTKATIEEYKKLKQSVITQAVTKGIRPNRPMKDSGIEWIGEVPADWNVVKASRLVVSTQNGLSRRDLEKSDGQIVLKLKNISPDGKISYSEINRIELTNKEIETYSLEDGDFLFVRVNGSKNLVGKCAIYKDISEIVAYNDHIIRVRLNEICNKRYFQYYLQSSSGKTEIDLHTSTAAGQFTISGEGLRDLYIVLPSNYEQNELADYLDKKCSEIDELITKKTSLLSELESYKKSLIYEYVTGKKEVK